MTATVSDGQLSANQTFSWAVSSTRAGQVVLVMNGTPDHSEDVALLGGGPMPVQVTLEHAGPGVHQITLQIPSGGASLDRTSIPMADGGSAVVMWTALQASAAEDDTSLLAQADAKAAGDGKATDEKVKFTTPVRNADTPAQMKQDRITVRTTGGKVPDEVQTMVKFTLSVPVPDKTIMGTITNNGNFNNGNAYFIDVNDNLARDGVNIARSRTGQLYVVGTGETEPGNAGNLQLVATVGTQTVKSKPGFSVAPIPLYVSDQYRGTRVPRGEVGIVVVNLWKSDSGSPRDLDQVRIKEVVETYMATNAAKDFKLETSDYEDASTGFSEDRHTAETRTLAAPGWEVRDNQISIFKDARTGASDIPMPNSGYKIYMVCYTNNAYMGIVDGKWRLRVKKIGATVSVTVGGKKLSSNTGATVPRPWIFKGGLQ